MGRFELIVLTRYERRYRREDPARPANRPGPSCSPAAVQIEQSVIWAESRQISVSGELDFSGADALQRPIADAVESGLPCIVLDLSSCRFLDAGALGVISGMQLQLAANGQELVVHGATGQVRRLIELARAISPQAWINEAR